MRGQPFSKIERFHWKYNARELDITSRKIEREYREEDRLSRESDNLLLKP